MVVVATEEEAATVTAIAIEIAEAAATTTTTEAAAAKIRGPNKKHNNFFLKKYFFKVEVSITGIFGALPPLFCRLSESESARSVAQEAALSVGERARGSIRALRERVKELTTEAEEEGLQGKRRNNDGSQEEGEYVT